MTIYHPMIHPHDELGAPREGNSRKGGVSAGQQGPV